MIDVTDLHKSFTAKTGTVHAVQGVSFSARDGEITGLLGPNGAGKTTTLRMLYTLMSADSGTITVDGFSTTAKSYEVRTRLGVLPDARGVVLSLVVAITVLSIIGRTSNSVMHSAFAQTNTRRGP